MEKLEKEHKTLVSIPRIFNVYNSHIFIHSNATLDKTGDVKIFYQIEIL